MKCDMIRDLLPSYIEKLTSSYSNEEIDKHLESCEACRQFHREMTGDTGLSMPKIDKAEAEKLNYFKKVKKINRRKVIISISVVLLLAVAFIWLFAIGTRVSSKDVDIVYNKNNGRLEVHLTLENGKDLLVSGKSKFIYDENDNVIGYETRYTPRGLFHNPFDDVGNEYMLGTQIRNEPNYPHSFILEFKDKSMTFINGELVE
ncbi:zf-HC2 domain-containing protein [Paenibacillus sp. NPDC058071]|uniref:zf-HC2 domain-containing protein n=1 Tax=Paenibacillus sp. NPDC058071 TaxID=3346326 RepID=UPI0036D968A3